MQFVKYEDRGRGICAVFSVEPREETIEKWNGEIQRLRTNETVFLRDDLEIRIKTLEKNGHDATLERSVLASWPQNS